VAYGGEFPVGPSPPGVLGQSLQVMGVGGGLSVRGGGPESAEDGGGIVLFCFFCFGKVVQGLFDDPLGFALLSGGAYFGGWGEEAVGGVEDDFFDEGFRLGCGELLGEVEAGDLEAVEQEAGAAGVDFVGGDAVEDFADGELDGAAVFRVGEAEGAAAGAAGGAGAEFHCGNRAAGGVVVVAEFFAGADAAEAGALATASVGEDVAADEAFGLCVWHG
jgi:hypothetical protein